MKKVKNAMLLAHAIKNIFGLTMGAALKAAWKIIKTNCVTFAKETGEIRTALINNITTIDREKGFCRFVEFVDEETTQFRSFRFERLLIV